MTTKSIKKDFQSEKITSKVAVALLILIDYNQNTAQLLVDGWKLEEY